MASPLKVHTRFYSSSVARGRAFELACIESLKDYSFDLKRVGGKNDRGVDLRGYWKLKNSRSLSPLKPSRPSVRECVSNTPSPSVWSENDYLHTDTSIENKLTTSHDHDSNISNYHITLDVIAQCKNTPSSKVGPHVLREFSSCLSPIFYTRSSSFILTYPRSSLSPEQISPNEVDLQKHSTTFTENQNILKSQQTIGLLITSGQFSMGTFQLHQRLCLPLILARIHHEENLLTQFHLNYAAQRLLPYTTVGMDCLERRIEILHRFP